MDSGRDSGTELLGNGTKELGNAQRVWHVQRHPVEASL
jgi:hypothetical protein